MLGILIGEGRLKLDDPVANYDEDLQELYSGVNFRHFATMTSGYSAAGRSRWSDENSDWSWTPYTPEAPHSTPGIHYEYWDEAKMTYGKTVKPTRRKTCSMEYFTQSYW